VDLPDPELGTATMSAPTPRLSDTPGAIRWVGPSLGAHNREVYAGELGLSDAEIERLEVDGVI
jgi:crotonobetainyl-CoA:carnitine CoA-transferase CaiB-like acyl-CoA transferase